MKKLILIAFVFLGIAAQAQTDTLGIINFEISTADAVVSVDRVVTYQAPKAEVSFYFYWSENVTGDSIQFNSDAKRVRVRAPELNTPVKLTIGQQTDTKTVLEWIVECQTHPQADKIYKALCKKVYNKRVANIPEN